MTAPTFNPCLLIPCYNHGRQIGHTLAALEQLQLPCLLIDDGSDVETAAVLDRLAQQHAWLTLARLPRNRGKGAAVAHGIALAAEHGYTHALQIDADGQHDSNDVPKLLALARDNPDALISGWPQYGDDMPSSRRYGRWITHVWVWIETLSFTIKDSMCGFRVYPVAATQQLLMRRQVGERMDFDTEIMVRLYWAGVSVLFQPTRVRYPEDGQSHFQLWRDNLQISWMHTRLVLEMPLHLPKLVAVKKTSAQPADRPWAQHAERGAQWGLRASLYCFRLLGRRGLGLLLYPIIAYFFVANRSARAASREYQQRLHRLGVLPLAPDNGAIYRHFLAFGSALADRMASWAGVMRRDELTFHGYEHFQRQVDSGRGAIIFTGHVGNMELTRSLLRQSPNAHVKINVLVFTRHAERFNQLMREVNPNSALSLLQVDELGPASALALQQKIEAGEWLVIAADRTSPTAPERIVNADFLGEPAPFPQGPFILAALLRCPVLLLFCLRERDGYHVHIESFAERIELPRKQRAEALAVCAQRFAAVLERMVRRAPLQWFNFYDFWRKPATDSSTQRTP